MREIVLALVLLGTTAHAWDDRVLAPATEPLVAQRGFERQQVVPVPGNGQCQTRANIFGSVTIDCGTDRPKIVCRPNVFDGVTCE
jgi:hypothetical protein